MTLIESREEFTLTLTKAEVLTIAEALENGSRYRLERQKTAISKGQHAEVSPTVEGNKSSQFSKLRKQLMDTCGIEGSWHT